MSDYSAKSFFIRPSNKGIQDFKELINRDYEIRVSEWLKAGWEIFKKDAGISIAFAVVAAICFVLLSSVPFAGFLIYYPVLAGFIIVSLMFFRNETVGFTNYLWGFRHFLPLLVFTVVSSVFITIGIFLLVVPGIYLTVAYLFAAHLIVEKNIDFWPAMEISRKKVNKHWFGMFGFCLVITLINIAGCIPVFLGLFITIPLSVCMITAAYRDLFMDQDRTIVPAQPTGPAAES